MLAPRQQPGRGALTVVEEPAKGFVGLGGVALVTGDIGQGVQNLVQAHMVVRICPAEVPVGISNSPVFPVVKPLLKQLPDCRIIENLHRLAIERRSKKR